MTTFKIGDCVRRKGDPNKTQLVVRTIIKAQNDFQHVCISECGKHVDLAYREDIELIESSCDNHDLKQAIREVLLSEEFLAAFAKAWLKTPINELVEPFYQLTKEETE